MSLKTILAKASAELGMSLDVPSERAILLDKVNEAAKELYESRDLVHCEREQLLSLDNAQQLIALPTYIGKLRGIRNASTRRGIPLHDMRPRFKSDGWTESLLAIRVREVRPIKRDLTNTAPVTLSIPAAEAAAFSVVVGGPTPHSDRTINTITFAIGETSKVVPASHTDIQIFSNVSPHQYDVTMTDSDGNELAVLPNWADRSEYQIVQALDYLVLSPGTPYLAEVLYKMAWRPMREDYDEFLCPGYDDAIYWQTLGNYKGKTDINMAAACLQKALAIVKQIEEDFTGPIEKQIDFCPNPLSYACGTSPARWIEP